MVYGNCTLKQNGNNCYYEWTLPPYYNGTIDNFSNNFTCSGTIECGYNIEDPVTLCPDSECDLINKLYPIGTITSGSVALIIIIAIIISFIRNRDDKYGYRSIG